MFYTMSALFVVVALVAGCGQAADGAAPAAGGGLVLENKTTKEVAVLGVSFDGKREFPAMALGAGASATLMGRIASVRGVPSVHYTYGSVGDASVEAEMARIEYVGGLDRLVLRLAANDRWILSGEKAGVEVFRSEETSRKDNPPTK